MRKLFAVGALALAALAARRHTAMRDAVAAVAPELRSPFLSMIPTAPSVRTLPLWRLQSRLRLPSGRGVTVTERHVGEPPVRVLVTAPVDRKAFAPAVLWLHSGGMFLGSSQSESPLTARLARELDAIVVSPDYRLTPEHPFPPHWTTAWRRCRGCARTPTSWASTPVGRCGRSECRGRPVGSRRAEKP